MRTPESRRRQHRLPIVVVAAALASVEASAAIPTAERDALIAVYTSTNGASWMNNTGWLGTPGTECSWERVTCDGSGATVIQLSLSANLLSGVIPPEVADLTNLEGLYLDSNQLSGAIPAQLASLTHLQHLWLHANQLSGAIPTELASLGNLRGLFLYLNHLTGAIPSELGNLTRLEYLNLSANELSGTIPAQLGGLTNLWWLALSGNQLSGVIPPQLGGLTNLQSLFLDSNQLIGAVPGDLGNLTSLRYLDLRWNALHSSDATLVAFLDSKQSGGDWQGTQTVAPANLSAARTGLTTASLSWTPIAYTDDTGGYRVFVSTASGSGYALVTTTADKSASGATLTGLTPGADYYVVVDTVTNPHANNRNTVISERTAEVPILPGLGFYTIMPCRLVDTRNASGPYGGPGLAAGAVRVFAFAGQCEIPAAARAVSVNVTVTASTAPGNLRLYEAGVSLPSTSTINYSTGQTRANNAVVSLNGSGEMAVYCSQSSGMVQLILDFNGYFAP